MALEGTYGLWQVKEGEVLLARDSEQAQRDARTIFGIGFENGIMKVMPGELSPDLRDSYRRAVEVLGERSLEHHAFLLPGDFRIISLPRNKGRAIKNN